MPVTIRDVAKKAGVTIGTVSRAFNGYPDILVETREKIYSAARELGYSPNLNARSLAAKMPPNLGFIVSGLLESNSKDNLLYQLLQGIYQYSLNNGLNVALYATDHIEQSKKSYTRFCREHSISGAILCGITTSDAYFSELIDSKIPCVAFDIEVVGKTVGYVSIDNAAAADELASYLMRMGHRRIMILSGKKNSTVNTQRMQGIASAYARSGKVLEDHRILYCNFSEEIAYDTVYDYLKRHGKADCTAFLCFSDVMALGVMRAIRDCGYSVPEDFSVAGFDGLPISEYTAPPLTTVLQDLRKAGNACAELLHGMMQGKTEGIHRVLPHKLIERQSVKMIHEEGRQ